MMKYSTTNIATRGSRLTRLDSGAAAGAAWAKALEMNTEDSLLGRHIAANEMAKLDSWHCGRGFYGGAECDCMSDSHPPSLALDGRIAMVTLRRPQQANRLELNDLGVLQSIADTLALMPDVLVVVLQSYGRHFSSGFDVNSVLAIDAPAQFEKLGETWELLPQISIAALQGGVWGGACDLALACDFRLGTAQCTATVPAARIGLQYHDGGIRRLLTRAGPSLSKRLLLRAETLEASALLRHGFLDEVFGNEAALRAGVRQWAQAASNLAPLAIRGMKERLNLLAAGCAASYMARASSDRCRTSADLREGVLAWTEGRTPRFQGA